MAEAGTGDIAIVPSRVLFSGNRLWDAMQALSNPIDSVEKGVASVRLFFRYARVVGVLLVALSGEAQHPVQFGDLDFDELIHRELGIPDESRVLDTDMASLTELSVDGIGLSSLQGIEFAVNLTRLELRACQIEDLSRLATLRQLEELSLSGNRIDSVLPLSQLSGLRLLDLSMNGVSDLSPLAGLGSLMALDVSWNRVQDLAPLGELASHGELARLEIDHNALDLHSLCDTIPNLVGAGVAVYVANRGGNAIYNAGAAQVLCEDPNGDPDNDGLANLAEFNEGTFIDVGDTDHDGYLDGEEVAAGTSPNDNADAPIPFRVQFPDSVLEDAVREELGISRGVLVEQDVEMLTNLSVYGPVGSLEGLQFAVNLQQLFISNGDVVDLSPILGLGRLEELSVTGQQIETLPDMSGLRSLRRLHLDRNRLTDIAPLCALPGLFSVSLADNAISDASPLGSMTGLGGLILDGNPLESTEFLFSLTRLGSLSLAGTGLTDISFVKPMNSLAHFFAPHNQIESLAPLQGHVLLARLDVSDNRISELGPLTGLPLLLKVWAGGNEIRSVAPLLFSRLLYLLDVSDNQLAEVAPLGTFGNLHELDVSSNRITSLDFARSLRSLTRLNASSNPITDIGFLASLTALEMLELNNTEFTDISQLEWPPSLRELRVDENQITDLQPFVEGYVAPDFRDLRRNPIDLTSLCAYGTEFLNTGAYSQLPVDLTGLEVVCSDPEGDQDLDGVGNYDEILAGSDPLVSDTDGDGFGDGEELEAGTYPFNSDSTPVENPSTLTSLKMAERLLLRFEELSLAPAGNRLTFRDCAIAIPNLAFAQFEALDANGSGTLSRGELAGIVAMSSGCYLQPDAAGQNEASAGGNVVVLGMLLLALSGKRLRRNA